MASRPHYAQVANSVPRSGRLSPLHVPRRDLSHESQERVLEIVVLEGVAAAEAALLNVDRLGPPVFIASVARDDTSLIVVAGSRGPCSANISFRNSRLGSA